MLGWVNAVLEDDRTLEAPGDEWPETPQSVALREAVQVGKDLEERRR